MYSYSFYIDCEITMDYACVIFELELNYSANFLPTLFALDDYDSCVARNNTYCLVTFDLISGINDDLIKKINNHSKFQKTHYNYTHIDRGVCVQDSCQDYIIDGSEDLHPVLEACQNKTIWEQYGLQVKISKVKSCTNANDAKIMIDIWDKLVALVIIIIVTLNIVGSLVNIQSRGRKGAPEDDVYLTAFSIHENWKSLTTLDINDSRTSIFAVFHGAKILCTCLVVWGHVNFLTLGSFIKAPQALEKKYDDSPLFILIVNGPMIVQIFFFMAGTLCVFNLLLTKEKRTVSWKDYGDLILTRWFRLTPAYVVVLAFTSTWLRHLYNGPLWNAYINNSVVRDCTQYWWTHLLYINNYFPDNKFCCMQTWHVAADYQLYVVGVAIFIGVLSRHRTFIMALFLMLSILAPALTIIYSKLEPIFFLTPEDFRYLFQGNDTFHFMHKFGHNNLSSYLIGMINGYLLYSWHKKNIDLSEYKALTFSAWIGVVATILIVFEGKIFYDEPTKVPWLIRIAFGALYRSAIGIIMAYLHTICTFAPKCSVNRFFGWSGWVVPGRLTYCVYLVHFNICHVYFARKRKISNITLSDTAVDTIWILLQSYVLALVLYIMVESPFNEVVRIYKKRRAIRKQEDKNK